MSNPHPVPDQASSTSEIDPYVLHESRIKEPPGTFKESLKYLGPGFILSASIVGSGELFATTIAGADASFVLMWFIIFSCLVKVAVQLEFGKHAISSGEATMTSLNTLPGPRFKGANWSIWAWLLLMVFKMMQVGGIVGGVVWAIEEFAPAWKDTPVIHIPLTFMVAGSVSLLIFRGYYTLIEKASLIMIGGFTLFTVISLCSLQFTDNAITFSQIGSGLIPSVPDDMKILFVAMGAFGITGVGGDEIMAYNYWLIEKGYAAYTGPRNDSPEWEHRAKGWIKVMYWDAICSMVAYTAMTVMFYLLGAAVLHGTDFDRGDLIAELGQMYTTTLGPEYNTLWILGAIVVLYSTLMGALAAWTRMFSDAFGQIGLINFSNHAQRKTAIAWLAWVIPALWGLLFLILDNPALMVFLGGLVTVVILLIVALAAVFFRNKRLDPRLKPSRAYDVVLYSSIIAIVLAAGVSLYKAVKDFSEVDDKDSSTEVEARETNTDSDNPTGDSRSDTGNKVSNNPDSETDTSNEAAMEDSDKQTDEQVDQEAGQ